MTALARGAAWAVLVLAGAETAAWGATRIEGDYQLMMELRKDFRAFPWDFDSNDDGTGTPAQIRLLSLPTSGVEAFVKFEAEWHRNNNRAERPEFQYRDAHLKLRRDLGGRGIESIFFSRQDRFWVNTYLIPFVQGRGDAQGVRLDTWGFLGLNTTWIMADQSSQLDPAGMLEDYRNRTGGGDAGIPPPKAPLDSLLAQRRLRTDDLYVVRLRRQFLDDDALRLGLTYNRYESWEGRDSVSGPGAIKTVAGFDGRLRIAGADVSFEYGEKWPAAGDAANPPLTVFKRPTGLRLPDHSVFQAEVRSLRIGTDRLGKAAVTPGWWARGPLWENALGGPGRDETGFVIQSYYLLPERAITYTNQLLWYANKAFSRNATKEVYNELYVEFVNGFTGKTAYRRRDEYRTRGGRLTRESHLSWFNEVQVESRLAWLRVQSKLRDIGRSDRKQLFVIEQRINLTDKTKVYNRFALGNDASILRKGIFTQLQYRPTGSMELFLQYGPDNIGGGSVPVDEGNLGGSGDQSDVLKLILKGNF